MLEEVKEDQANANESASTSPERLNLPESEEIDYTTKSELNALLTANPLAEGFIICVESFVGLSTKSLFNKIFDIGDEEKCSMKALWVENGDQIKEIIPWEAPPESETVCPIFKREVLQ